MIAEQLDRRVLGTIQLVDAITGSIVRDRVRVTASGVQMVQNRSGRWVVVATPGIEALQSYTDAFLAAPAAPALGSIAIALDVRDASGFYLPRQQPIQLPRNPDAAASNSLFQAITVNLYRSPVALVAPGWAVIRATIIEQASGRRLPWALIRVVQTVPAAAVTLSQADWRGEALIAVPGIPVATASSGNGAVLTREVDVTLEVVFDPTLELLPSNTDVSLMRDPNGGYLPNPEDLNDRRASLRTGSVTTQLASGRDRSMALTVTLT